MSASEFDWTTLDLDQQLQDSDWGNAGEAGSESEPISIDPDGDVSTSGIDSAPYAEPDSGAIGKPTRTRGAPAYQRKLRGIFAKAIKWTALRPSTAPDSAALIMYSPRVADTLGELAAKDPRIARGIDMLTEGADNPYLEAAMTLFPLLTQLARNHEPVIEPKVRGFKIPFLMRKPIQLPFKIGVRLGALRSVTHDPETLANYVMNNPDVRQAFERQGITVAWPNGSNR